MSSRLVPLKGGVLDVGLLTEPRLDLHQLHDDFEAVYRLAFAEPPWSEGEAEVGRFMVRLSLHASHPGFRCVVARLDGVMAGFAYGFTTGEAPWTAMGQPPVASGAGLTDRLLVGAFQLAELAVVPAARRRGIGGRLHDVLLIGLPYDRAWLMTSPRARSALHLYRSRGWQTVAELEVPGRLDTRLIMVVNTGQSAPPVSGDEEEAPRPAPTDRQRQAVSRRLADPDALPIRPRPVAGDPGRSPHRVDHCQALRGFRHVMQLCQQDPGVGHAGS